MNGSLIPRARSITHEHLFGVIYNEISSKREMFEANGIRILDVGCGNGALIEYIHRGLRRLFPALQVSVYGLDIVDSGVQAQGFQSRTISSLMAAVTDVQWEERLSFITSDHGWPFQSDFFDIVLSNQVLEHVADHDHFFTNQCRVLRDGGIAIHLFPLREVLWEAHLHLPLVHRIRNWDVLTAWIARLSLCGLGKWRRSGMDLNTYSAGHADYLLHYTNYLSQCDVLDISKRMGLRASFAYTGSLYGRKLKSVLRLPNGVRSKTSRVFDVTFFRLLKRISGVTLFQEKKNEYRRFE